MTERPKTVDAWIEGFADALDPTPAERADIIASLQRMRDQIRKRKAVAPTDEDWERAKDLSKRLREWTDR
jgi:hypothetical protein